MVSVCMVTYNHEKLIGQALDSVLEQETDFAVEVVVGEDCSKDGTRDSLREYARRHPERVRPLFHEKNLGPHANFRTTFLSCRGRYIALLEGDDYWTDPGKLRLQVTHMEANPGCAVSFHNSWIDHPDGSRTLFHDQLAEASYTGADLFARWLVPTASALLRAPGWDDFPAFYHGGTHGDLALFLLMAERGSLDYMDRTMSAYRLHEGGLTRSFRGIEFNLDQVRFLEEMDRHFGGRYAEPLAQRIAALHRSNAIHHLNEGRGRDARDALATSLAVARPSDARGEREVRQVRWGSRAPGLYRAIRRLFGEG
jgi:glycosyltransferase involved in cell wall biosynthesis